MDYLTLFKANELLSSGLFTLGGLPGGGRDMHCFGQEDFAMIFCLQGSVAFDLRMEMKTQRFRLSEQHLVVIDKRCLQHCDCVPGTVILKYAFVGRMARYMSFTSRAFHAAASSVVPVLPRLREWIDRLVLKLMDDGSRHETFTDECAELARLLMEYPKSLLKELYVPVFACSRLCKKSGECPFSE